MFPTVVSSGDEFSCAYDSQQFKILLDISGIVSVLFLWTYQEECGAVSDHSLDISFDMAILYKLSFK